MYDFHGKGRSGFTRKPTGGAVLPRIKGYGRNGSATCRLSELLESLVGNITNRNDYIDELQHSRSWGDLRPSRLMYALNQEFPFARDLRSVR